MNDLVNTITSNQSQNFSTNTLIQNSISSILQELNSINCFLEEFTITKNTLSQQLELMKAQSTTQITDLRNHVNNTMQTLITQVSIKCNDLISQKKAYMQEELV